MTNVVSFPKSPAVQFAQAEEFLRLEMRMQLAAACGALTKPATAETLIDVVDRLSNTARLVDHYAAILQACK